MSEKIRLLPCGLDCPHLPVAKRVWAREALEALRRFAGHDITCMAGQNPGTPCGCGYEAVIKDFSQSLTVSKEARP